jgi:hypothetical protein
MWVVGLKANAEFLHQFNYRVGADPHFYQFNQIFFAERVSTLLRGAIDAYKRWNNATSRKGNSQRSPHDFASSSRHTGPKIVSSANGPVLFAEHIAGSLLLKTFKETAVAWADSKFVLIGEAAAGATLHCVPR